MPSVVHFLLFKTTLKTRFPPEWLLGHSWENCLLAVVLTFRHTLMLEARVTPLRKHKGAWCFRPMIFVMKPLSNHTKPRTPWYKDFLLSFVIIASFREQLCEHCTELIQTMVKFRLLPFQNIFKLIISHCSQFHTGGILIKTNEQTNQQTKNLN